MSASRTIHLRSRILLPALALALAMPTAAHAREYIGGPGPETIKGHENVVNNLDGDGGKDYIYGGNLADRLFGDAGGDHLFGRGGDDYLHGAAGDDELDGGSGNDELIGSWGRDRMLGSDGDDRLEAGGAGDTLDGGSGNDVVHGGGGEDYMSGGDGNDVMGSSDANFDSGPDHIDAGPGDDIVYVNNGTGVEEVDCGDGNDTLYINPREASGGWNNMDTRRSGGFSACESIVEAPATIDPTAGIKRMASSKSGETLTGTGLRDSLLGGPGPDLISAHAGDDVIWGNLNPDGPSFGSDTLHGGDGDDEIFGGRGANGIWGGNGNDTLQGGPYANKIYGEAGDDAIRTRGKGPTKVFGGPGNDTIKAYAKGPGMIDCGPGHDAVRIGFNRVLRTKNCEAVVKGYVVKSNRR